jgi:hypothetical protein
MSSGLIWPQAGVPLVALSLSIWVPKIFWVRTPVGVLPLGETLLIASATFPLSCSVCQFRMTKWKTSKTHLNTGKRIELEQVVGVQEAKVNTVGVPSFFDDLSSETAEHILGLGPALAHHLYKYQEHTHRKGRKWIPSPNHPTRIRRRKVDGLGRSRTGLYPLSSGLGGIGFGFILMVTTLVSGGGVRYESGIHKRITYASSNLSHRFQ